MYRIGRCWPVAVLVILTADLAMMAALPENWLAGEVAAMTALTAVVVIRVLAVMFKVGDGRPVDDETAPSPLMTTAARMAKAGASAAQIAERCALPLALAELVVSESGRTAGSRGPNGPRRASC